MRNKRRLYIAYLSRKATKENSIKVHTAFLLSPKNPEVNSDAKVSKLLHVKDVLTSSGKPIWTYVVEEVQARPPQVIGVQLLSKIPDSLEDKALQDILAGIPLSQNATDPTWRCRHWIWRAVDVSIPQRHRNTSSRRFPDELLIRHLSNMSSSLRSRFPRKCELRRSISRSSFL